MPRVGAKSRARPAQRRRRAAPRAETGPWLQGRGRSGRGPAGQYGRHNVAAENPVQLGRACLDVVDPGAFIGSLRALAQVLDQGENPRFSFGVEAEVAVIADDDGVGLVSVLVAHGAGQVQRQTHAVHARACLSQATIDLSEAEQRDRRGDGE